MKSDGPPNIQHRQTAAAALGRISPLFAYPEEVRRAIYTTNVVESLHMTLRKVMKAGLPCPAKKSG